MKEYKKIFIINAEIERNNQALAEIRRLRVSDELKSAYVRLIEEQTKELVQAKLKAENEINEIPDETARLIAKMRYIDLKTWGEIGKALNYDGSVVFRRCKKYLK